MYLFLSFVLGIFLMGLNHELIHRNSKLYYLTSMLTFSLYLKASHRIHHKHFLNSLDNFSWARKNESFYNFFMRTHYKRRLLSDKKIILADIFVLLIMAYLFGWYYVVVVFSFTFHWELFEYWSHYGLKQVTDNKYLWSWNVLDKIFNRFTYSLGYHSRHHASGGKYFPVVYGGLRHIYLPLLPTSYFQFMEKQIILNRRRGVF